MYNINLKFEHNLKQIKNKKMRIHKKDGPDFQQVICSLCNFKHWAAHIQGQLFVAAFRWWKCK